MLITLLVTIILSSSHFCLLPNRKFTSEVRIKTSLLFVGILNIIMLPLAKKNKIFYSSDSS